MKKNAINTINPEEVEKFSQMAETWWDPAGPFKPLHRFNPVRLTYIREHVLTHFGLKDEENALKELKILDIGCGGGLLCEPLTRQGAAVTGIDASEKNIKTASIHAEKERLSIDYRVMAAEELVKEHKGQFDVVLNMEVVEHVDDVPAFLKCSAELVKPGGLMFVATMNRTAKSFAFAIIGAEYVMRWLPKGTHDWRKFLKPEEVIVELSRAGLSLNSEHGVTYNPLSQRFSRSEDMSVNYVLSFSKKA